MKVGIRLGRERSIKREESNKIKSDLSDWGMSEQAVNVTVRLSDSHHARKRDTSHWLGLSNCKMEKGWMIWNFQKVG